MNYRCGCLSPRAELGATAAWSAARQPSAATCRLPRWEAAQKLASGLQNHPQSWHPLPRAQPSRPSLLGIVAPSGPGAALSLPQLLTSQPGWRSGIDGTLCRRPNQNSDVCSDGLLCDLQEGTSHPAKIAAMGGPVAPSAAAAGGGTRPQAGSSASLANPTGRGQGAASGHVRGFPVARHPSCAGQGTRRGFPPGRATHGSAQVLHQPLVAAAL